MLGIGPSFVDGVAYLRSAITGAAEPRNSLDQPRLGRNLSRLTEHRREGKTPLEYAVTKVAELIAPPHRDGASQAPGSVNKNSLEDYVRATLGMPHAADNISRDGDLALYLDELSKNESTRGAQPVTRSSFTLLCVLYLADQVPGPLEYGRFSRDAFVGWLNGQLGPGTVGDDLIPERYFDSVAVVKPETRFPNLCAIRSGDSGFVDVRAMSPFDLRKRDLRNVDLRNVDLRYADLSSAELTGSTLRGVNLRGANLFCAKLSSADLTGAVLQAANLFRAYLRDANLTGADLTDADLRAILCNVNLHDANLDVTPETAVEVVFSREANLTGTRLALSPEEPCQQYVRKSMAGWRAREFGMNLNHRNNEGRSVLKNIAGLDDSCRGTKQALMRGVVAGLDREWSKRPYRVEALIPSLGDVLFEDPEYLRGYDAFSKWLCAGMLGDGSTSLDPSLSDAALKAVGRYATDLLQAQAFKAILQRRDAIFQVLRTIQERAEAAP
jgi:uncharacterized protein YjbI with pentapeptide repeats